MTPGRRVDVDEIRAAFDRVGVETTTRREHASSRATEVVLGTDASVLGRCLVAMGAPLGCKTDLDRLPAVVWEVPTTVRESFVHVYVRDRATHHRSKATLTIREERPGTDLFCGDIPAIISVTLSETIALR